MGRPKKGIITDIAVRLLEMPHPDQPEKTRAEVLAEKWLKRAEEGDDFGQLLDRVEGKVPVEADVTVGPATQTLRDFLDGNDDPATGPADPGTEAGQVGEDG